MNGSPRAFATLDLGAATTAAALVALIDHRWRLLGSLAWPSSVSADHLLGLLSDRVRAADPALADALHLSPGAVLELPRLVVRSPEPGTIAVLAASDRALALLTSVVARSGWRWRAASAERHHAQALTAILLDPAVSAVLVAAGDPPGGDERAALSELGAIVAAAAQRRPELTIILGGSMAQARGRFGLPSERRRFGADPSRAAGDHEAASSGPADGARVIVGPRTVPGSPAWSGLLELLAGLRRDGADSRQGIASSAIGLAGALDRRIEVIEIGMNGGLRATGEPGREAGHGVGQAIISAQGGLVAPEIDEARLDRVQGWSSLRFDRHRLRDRLIELRATPWSGVSGDGARLRLAAARAAMGRLVDLTPEMTDGPNPDLLVLAGGAFAPAPAAAVLLAVADVVRRPAAIHVAYDHARLMGPLGMIEDPAERDRLLADLAGDLLVPLGAIVMPAAIRAGRRMGRVVVDSPGGTMTLGLDVGALEHVPLAAGERAAIFLESAEPIVLGSRGRRITVEVAGGVAGLLVDLRDVPIRLPERREPRRELLSHWEEAAWPGGVG